MANLLEIVQTKASLLKKQRIEEDFKAIIFEPPNESSTTFSREPISTRTKKFLLDDDEEDNLDDHSRKRKIKPVDPTEFDIKKARHEIIMFANSGQSEINNQKKAEINLLVKLGAKPPKRKNENYKELIEERKRLKKLDEEKTNKLQIGKNMNGACLVKCNSRKNKSRKSKSRVVVDKISKNYGVVNPKIGKRK